MSEGNRLSVLILTKNEERDLAGCLRSVQWCDDVHVFDSYSTDDTVNIARRMGCSVVQRQFDNWAAHQNWGIKNIPFKHSWVLYIDADERVSEELHVAAAAAVQSPRHVVAFQIRRRDFYSDGTWLKHAQISPFYIRLFKPERVRYERLVNPVSIVEGPIASISGYLDHYPFSKGIGFWIERHVKYADLEAKNIIINRKAGGKVSFRKAFFAAEFSERRFHQKALFYRMPFRPVVKFLYMCFLRCGFLDGRAGVTYCILQSIYEYFIVLKEREFDSKNVE